MKHLILILTWLIPFWAFAQFEGEIAMQTTHQAIGEEARLIWKIKDKRHLLNISSQTETLSMDYQLLIWEKEQKCWFLSDKPSKAAYVLPFAQLTKGGLLEVPLNSVVREQGDGGKIASHPCKKYQIATSDTIIEIWMAEGTELAYSDFPDFMNRGNLSAVLRLSSIPGIPLKFEQKDQKGNVALSQEITRITAKSLSDSDFEIPSDYTLNPGAGQ